MNKILISMQLGVILIVVIVAVYMHAAQRNIAYVRSQEILERFYGTTEARKEFERQKQDLMQNVDSLKTAFELLRMKYFTDVHRMSVAERGVREEELDMRQSQLLEYGRAIDTKIAEADKTLMQQVLNQINSSIEDFAKKSGYDIILGTTSDGSLLYGDDALDVTDEVVLKLNQTYKGLNEN